MVGKEVRRISHGYHYFFVKPKQNGSVDKAVARLMEIDVVKEVSVTEGEYGFVVRTNGIHEDDTEVLSRIRKVVKGKPAKAICYCSYVK
jgi:hypothetical protein